MTNKPEVLGFFVEWSCNNEEGEFKLSLDHFTTRVDYCSIFGGDCRLVPVIRLSDYEALQAECEQLRKDAAAALIGLPDSLPMEPYQTVDRGSPHYKAGWNACRRAMIAALEELMEDPIHDQ